MILVSREKCRLGYVTEFLFGVGLCVCMRSIRATRSYIGRRPFRAVGILTAVLFAGSPNGTGGTVPYDKAVSFVNA